jgi:hypothetical protein
MSLGPIFIHCKDNRLYRGLTYWAEDGQWFICFDDDDPPEIVIACDRLGRRPTLSDVEQILVEVKIPFVRNSIKVGGASQRLFMKGPLSYGPRKKDQRPQVFKDALSFFFDVEAKAFPSPRPWDEFEEDLDARGSRTFGGTFYGG